MAQEIERKFLVQGDAWRTDGGAHYRQGYLTVDKARTVRVRTVHERASGEQAGYLTIKGKSQGASRAEYEYEIPMADATELLDQLCLRPLIEKIRYRIPHADLIWEVDEFLGENAGLIVAEVELTSVEQAFVKPAWVGQEVTTDRRYFNASLVTHPFSQW
ncbi:MAG: CYTH domain-containing protein [Caldilineaceae bacterium]|nr:CYTH domain-containing protein [Caldilineaceae bacterium]